MLVRDAGRALAEEGPVSAIPPVYPSVQGHLLKIMLARAKQSSRKIGPVLNGNVRALANEVQTALTFMIIGGDMVDVGTIRLRELGDRDGESS